MAERMKPAEVQGEEEKREMKSSPELGALAQKYGADLSTFESWLKDQSDKIQDETGVLFGDYNKHTAEFVRQGILAILDEQLGDLARDLNPESITSGLALQERLSEAKVAATAILNDRIAKIAMAKSTKDYAKTIGALGPNYPQLAQMAADLLLYGGFSSYEEAFNAMTQLTLGERQMDKEALPDLYAQRRENIEAGKRSAILAALGQEVIASRK